MESIRSYIQTQFASDAPETIMRKNAFSEYLGKLLISDDTIRYGFDQVRGDGNCFFRAMLRFLGHLTIDNIPNKNCEDMNPEELEIYTNALEYFRETSRDFIREFIGDCEFELDLNHPEYQMICKFFADTMGFRIVVLEYDAFKPILNKVSYYVPESTPEDFTSTVILLNFSHHFTLITPYSNQSTVSNSEARKNVGDHVICKAIEFNLIM